MKERLTNNLGLKVLAIFLAFFLWLIVSNVSNPPVSRSHEIPVEIINDDILAKNNLTYEVVGKKTVTVNYKVHTLDAYKISPNDFYAYADVSELYDVTGSIPVKIDVVNNKGLLDGAPSTSPGVIQIETEEIQKKPFELQVHTDGEKPEDGYAPGNITLTPDTIYATGAVSAIGKINSIGVVIKTGGVNADTTGIVTPIFYDSNGNSMDMGDDVTLSTTEIEYYMSVLKVKSLGLDFQPQGSVADGYRFTGVESDIKSVSVEGMKSALASLNTLSIPGEYLNLDGATKDIVVQVDLGKLLPENVTIAGGKEAVATVTLKVEPLEIRGFKFVMDDVKLLGMSEDYKYEFSSKVIQVDIEGLSDDLDALKSSDLEPVVDVSGMAEGEHKGALTLNLGEGFAVTNSEGFQIIVTLADESSGDSTVNSTLPEDSSASDEESKETTKEALKETTKGSD